jgi:hypothetical protein
LHPIAGLVSPALWFFHSSPEPIVLNHNLRLFFDSFSSRMPQLWKTSRLPERPAGPPTLAKTFDASNGPRRLAAANLPPLIVNHQPAASSDSGQHRTNGAMFGDRSPVEPTSPTSPHYDQLLIELRLAQVQSPPSRSSRTKHFPFGSIDDGA